MAIVTGDQYLNSLVNFVNRNAGALLDGTVTLKLNPMGLQYVKSRLDALGDLEGLVAVDYLRAYVSDLGDHRALTQLRRILGLLTSLKVISTLPDKARDPTPISLVYFGRLRVLELRGCDLSTSSAKGLLELRHSLERLICHNSTDALKHVFAGRIADIKDCPVWNKLTFVSCACNDVVLMDESLTLLPVVETLDLSRNQFARVDNLTKCIKLQQLDLGFNHLQSIASLIEVPCQMVKLILRNNALTALRGLENLKSLEGLDLSYNIISSFTELEILTSLPSLQNLWLEGNPICYARWYRVLVFSFFSNPENLKLDGKEISTGEYWERHVIFASRQKKPPGWFYFPAKDVSEDGGNSKGEKKKYSRIASIEDEDQGRLDGTDVPDHESMSSCGDDIQNLEPSKSDCDSKIVGFMNRVELMKKEKSHLWLREYKEFMDQSCEDIQDKTSHESPAIQGKERYLKHKKDQKVLDSKLRHVPNIVEVSKSVYSPNSMEADVFFADTYFSRHDGETSNSVVSVEQIDGLNGSVNEMVKGTSSEQGKLGTQPYEIKDNRVLVKENYSNFSALSEGDWQEEKTMKLVPSAIHVQALGSDLSPTHIKSPPHYQEDILHRRLFLEEEFLQLSSEPQNVEPSDSDTSCSDSTSCELNSSSSDFDEILFEASQERESNSLSSSLKENCHVNTTDDRLLMEKKLCLSDSYSDNTRMNTTDIGRNASFVDDILRNGGSGALEEKKSRVRVKRRIVSVSNDFHACKENLGRLDHRDLAVADYSSYATKPNLVPLINESIKDYFHLKIADSTTSEICEKVVLCRSVLESESFSEERDVAIVWSSENTFYVLLLNATPDSLDITYKVLGCHMLVDIREVVVGLGLQALRVFLVGGENYLFLTRNFEVSKDLLCLLQLLDSTQTCSACSLKSWEQVQMKLLEECVGMSLEVGVSAYSMLLFRDDSNAGELYFARSLFVVEGCLLVCLEDLVEFGSFTDDCSLSYPYYSVDSSCLIQNILEMVIELHGNMCLTMKLSNVLRGISCLPTKCRKEQYSAESGKVVTWKLKWFSEVSLLKFVSLVKAFHSGFSSSPLPIKYLS